MHEPKNYSCPFCEILKDKHGRSDEILIETQYSVCILGLHGNIKSGPTFLVTSKEHYENLYDLPDPIIADAFSLAKKVSLKIRKEFNVDGTTLWQHNEPAGNQDVWHFHIHVKGRKFNDLLYQETNIVLSDEKRSEWKNIMREVP